MADNFVPQYPHFNRFSDLSTLPSDLSSQHSSTRWSHLPPPDRALAFAAQWDSNAGTVTLSNPHSIAACKPYPLLHSSNDLPSDVVPDDDHSQLSTDTLTIDPRSDTNSRLSITTDALTQFDQPSSLSLLGSPVASSAACGPDTFLQTRRSRRAKPAHYSCFDRLDADLTFDATKAFVDLERIILGTNPNHRIVDTDDRWTTTPPHDPNPNPNRNVFLVQLAMQSTYSTALTSTSNYIYVPRTYRPDSPHQQRHRESLARPRDVLSREYNYLSESPRSPDSDLENKTPKFMRGFRRWKRRRSRSEDDGWVMVDVTQVITQSYVQEA